MDVLHQNTNIIATYSPLEVVLNCIWNNWIGLSETIFNLNLRGEKSYVSVHVCEYIWMAIEWTVVDIFVFIGFQKLVFKNLLLQNGESRSSDNNMEKSEAVSSIVSTMLGCSIDEVDKATIQMRKKQMGRICSFFPQVPVSSNHYGQTSPMPSLGSNKHPN